MRQVMKETQDRVRMFEESQRKWQEQQQAQSPEMVRPFYFNKFYSLCINNNNILTPPPLMYNVKFVRV